MSGPWDDFAPAPTTAAATTAAVDLQPWEQYAPAAKPPPAPAPTAKTPEEVHSGVQNMLKKRAPLVDIQKFVQGSGFSIAPDTQKWLEDHYSEATKKGMPDQHWDVNVRGAPEKTNVLSSWWHGMQSGALRGYDDELSGVSGAVGNEIGSALGMNKSNADFWDRYTAIRDQSREAKDRAFQDHPVAYGLGFVPGAVTGPSYFRTPAESLGGRVAQASGTAAIEGGISGSGNAEGGVVDRATSGAEGAGLGALLGPAFYPIGNAVGGLVARLAERLRPANGVNALNSGLDVLASRAPQDADAMATRAQAMGAAGVPVRLADVVDDSGRGVVRAAGAKMTPAREDLTQHARGVYEDVQDRVAGQARKHISDSPKTARQISTRIAEEQAAMGPRFDAVRDAPVELTPEITKALNTTEGRNVLRVIGKYMTPDEQGALNGLIKGLQAAAKNGSVADQAEKLVPGFSRMSPAAQQQVLKQLDLKDPMEGVNLTVDIADKFARLITNRAGENPGMARVAQKYADTIRGAARAQHPEYDAALNDFADVANVGNAAAGERQFENTDFLSTPPDQYAPAIGGASSNRPDYALPTAREALQIRARDQVVDKATAGSGSGAPGVARQIAYGSKAAGQGARNRALLGEEDAQNLEHGMRQELTRLDNTRYIDPNIGSKTAPMSEDIAAANEGVHLAAEVASHGKWGLIRGVSKWLRGAGIRGIDAERLTRDAISEDPARVQAAMDYLGKKGLDQARSRGLMRQIKRNSLNLPGRAAGAYTGDEKPQAPPNSVRAILREGGRQ